MTIVEACIVVVQRQRCCVGTHMVHMIRVMCSQSLVSAVKVV